MTRDNQDGPNRAGKLARGTYSAPTGGEVKPVVDWQIPAIGGRSLTPEQTRELADFMEHVASQSEWQREWLKFILLGENPDEVADALREAADESEAETERFKEAVEREKQRALKD